MAHTPGPWYVKSGAIKVRGGKTILQSLLITSSSEEVNQQRDANLRLAAAAPELLETLRRILEYSGDPVIESMCMVGILKAEGC